MIGKKKVNCALPALTKSPMVLYFERTESEMVRSNKTIIKIQFWHKVLRKRRDSSSSPGMYMIMDNITLFIAKKNIS